ncbi:hypothetical protein FBEOM_13194 [Fusarium beomiforme]|uniref:Uncharacterized protein n=1 Tax=Fusarium beomiforme TaxID=44412 RepID=A0A9P5DSC0_9HYPO|nr:hypothetical protein FBEOM_13194 [Fusarium beomiforme]
MEQTKIILVAVVAILFWAAPAFSLAYILFKRTFCRWHESRLLPPVTCLALALCWPVALLLVCPAALFSTSSSRAAGKNQEVDSNTSSQSTHGYFVRLFGHRDSKVGSPSRIWDTEAQTWTIAGSLSTVQHSSSHEAVEPYDNTGLSNKDHIHRGSDTLAIEQVNGCHSQMVYNTMNSPAEYLKAEEGKIFQLPIPDAPPPVYKASS